MNDDIDYDQLIADMREENERMIAEWQQEALEQFKNNFGQSVRSGIVQRLTL